MATMRVKQSAGAGARFAKRAFERQIGQSVPLTLQGVPLGSGKLVGAEVVEGGTAVWLTFELPSLPDPSTSDRPGFSFRESDDDDGGLVSAS